VPEEKRKECWWLVRRDGTPLPGDRGGGVEVLVIVARTRPLGNVLRALRLSWLLDGIDTVVAGQRKWMGKLVPDGAAPRRFP